MTSPRPPDARLFELYAELLDKAERERRWHVFDDVPFGELSGDRDETLAGPAETFFAAHAAMPDFVAKGLEAARAVPSLRAFLATFAYEKSRHQLALRTWLERSGSRTRGQLDRLEATVLSTRSEVPFEVARQLVFYGAIQELATFVTYAKHREVARARGDVCLRTIYDFAARDELALARFFESATSAFLDADRSGTVADMAFVLERFVSPAELVLEDHEERMLAVRQVGLDRGVFIQRVYAPVLRRLGVTRRDLATPRPRPASATPVQPIC